MSDHIDWKKIFEVERFKYYWCIGSNCFEDVGHQEIEEAEKLLGYPFPNQLKSFYQQIGYGRLDTPHNPPEGYIFYSSNEILPPMTVARFAKGIRFWEGEGVEEQRHWIDEFTTEYLQPGDLPFFEIGDSNSFLIMRAFSDNPNAVWDSSGDIKIEDSLERFIWRLYYESPSYYGDIFEAWLADRK